MEPSRVRGRLRAVPRSLLLILYVAGSLVAACAEDAAPSLTRTAFPTTLNGTTWTAVLIGNLQTVAGSEPTASFSATELTGDTGCNLYTGSYTYAKGVIKIVETSSTARACVDPAAGATESRFMTVLAGVSSASMDADGRLVLQGSVGSITFVVGPVSVPAASG